MISVRLSVRPCVRQAVRPCPKFNVAIFSVANIATLLKLHMLITALDLYPWVPLLMTFDLYLHTTRTEYLRARLHTCAHGTEMKLGIHVCNW